jgi:galactose-1-phosphate uridylyltransferase
MKYLASVEQITSLFLVDVMPEDAAKQIRNFYKKNGI